MLDVQLGGFRAVMCSMMKMPLRGVGVMRGGLVITVFVMPCGFAMMSRGVLVMLGCLMMVLCCLFGHAFLLVSSAGS